MATENSGEKRGLHPSLRSQMGYGTAKLSVASNKSAPKTRKFISRQLLRTDTLMGITLKYGVTLQDLKKENKLWNNDHFFLKETILIPLTPENEGMLDENDTIVSFEGSSSGFSSPTSPSSQLPNGDLTNLTPSSSKHSYTQDEFSNGASASSTSSSGPAPTSNDFFAKYDTSIARLKGDVAKMEKNAANLEGIIDANPLSLPPRKGSGAYHRDSISSSSGSDRRARFIVDDDDDNSPVLLIRSRTNSKQVRSTIENLQQVNDDLFKL